MATFAASLMPVLMGVTFDDVPRLVWAAPSACDDELFEFCPLSVVDGFFENVSVGDVLEVDLVEEVGLCKVS